MKRFAKVWLFRRTGGGRMLRSLPSRTFTLVASLSAVLWIGSLTCNANAQSLGEDMYLQHCAVCHQPDGRGIPGFFPPLANNATVISEGKDEVQKYLGRIIFGFHGGLIVNGQMYAGRMPPIGYRGRINDGELLALVNYQRAAWGNDARPITYSELAEARAAGAP
jgi:mono/diheme cytochrome c family protein